MNEALMQIFQSLPGPVRSLAATARGARLYTRRYGPETDRLVREAHEREQWTRADWKIWQEDRLSDLLHRAATRVPYYRQLWEERRRRGDCTSWEVLGNWPILEKETLRRTPDAFIADDCDRRRMIHDHTSGTTGKPLDLWQSQNTVRAWYALFEARSRRWYGVSRNDRWAILGGQTVTRVSQRRPPFWVWNAALKQLYMSSYHLAPDLVPHYLDALRRYKIVYLLGYTSSLYALAQEILRGKRPDLQMAVVVTNAEPVFDYQRAAIAEAFRCPVRETYGMAEIAFAAGECESGGIHIWPEAGVGEIVRDGRTVANGESGELICTGLINRDMPLIRYRVGDRATLPQIQSACECGRTLPLLASIEGRNDDVLYTVDGRQIGRLDPVFKNDLPIREAQIIQESLNCVRVRYAPSPEYTAEAGRIIVDRLRERMGRIEIVLEAVDEIPRTANGKFRAVICKLEKPQMPAVTEQPAPVVLHA